MKKSETNKRVSKKKILLLIICGLAIILIVSFIFTRNGSDCQRIANKIANLFEGATIVDRGADIEHEYSYVDSSVIYTKEVGTVENGKPALLILKCNSDIEANLLTKFINEKYVLAHKKVDGTILETLDTINEFFVDESYLIFTQGAYVIRINSYYQKDFDKLKSEIINILQKNNVKNVESADADKINNYWSEKLKETSNKLEQSHAEAIDNFKNITNEYIEKIESCINDECDKYLNEILVYKQYTEITEQVNIIQNKYDEVMNKKKEVVNQINSTISGVEKTLKKTDYDKVKKQIEELNDNYYDDYKKDWEKRLESIDKEVYKKDCETFKYKDVLRNPEKYEGKNSYWFGEVLQVVDKSFLGTTMRVGVDCTKYQYIEGYSCDNTIYVTYSGDESIIEEDMIEIYGTMAGNQTYTTVMGASITIPKVNAKYIIIK